MPSEPWFLWMSGGWITHRPKSGCLVPRYDDGTLYIGVEDFLLDEAALDL
ncbi:hypothetical protein [Neisseria cinerea]|nr:hypothetical protein [Neisseria cinerea]